MDRVGPAWASILSPIGAAVGGGVGVVAEHAEKQRLGWAWFGIGAGVGVIVGGLVGIGFGWWTSRRNGPIRATRPLPAINAKFTGRQPELQWLKSARPTRGQKVPTVQVVAGLSGVGKRQGG